MRYVFVALLIIAIVSTPALTELPKRGPAENYTLLKCVEKSDVVAIGTVKTLEGVYRQNVLPTGAAMITTDVLIKVEHLIKGETNFGETHIKMMILGGTAYVPDEDEVMRLEVKPQPKFKVGEKVMLFIRNTSTPTAYRNYAHNQYRLYKFKYGKRLIENDKIKMLYPGNTIEIPVDLAKDLSKAFLTDKDGAMLLEQDIKTAALTSKKLPDNIATRLKASAKQILKEESK